MAGLWLYLTEVNLLPQIQYGSLKTGHGLVVYRLLLTSRYLTYKQNSKDHTHVLEVEPSVVLIPETSDMAL